MRNIIIFVALLGAAAIFTVLYCLIAAGSQGGTDEYANLRIVHKDIKSLIYSNDVKIIKSLIDLFDCRAPAKIAKLNKWRAKAGLEAINLITINQTLK